MKMGLKKKVFVAFNRLDHSGIQNTLTQLNDLIDKGYRFTQSDLLVDKPNFRVGSPSFSLTLADGVDEPSEVDAEAQKRSDELSGFLSKVKLLEDKESMLNLATEMGVSVPKDLKTANAVKKWLVEYINALLR